MEPLEQIIKALDDAVELIGKLADENKELLLEKECLQAEVESHKKKIDKLWGELMENEKEKVEERMKRITVIETENTGDKMFTKRKENDHRRSIGRDSHRLSSKNGKRQFSGRR